MARKKFRLLSTHKLVSIGTILFLVVSLVAAVLILSGKYSFDIREHAKECQCDQNNTCGSGYTCSNQTCGTCVKVVTQCSKISQKCDNVYVKCCGTLKCVGASYGTWGTCR